MVELHANSSPGMALTFRDGLIRTLVWPYRRPTEIVLAILCLGLLARSAWNRDFVPEFWLLGFATAFFYSVALAMNPARLALVGAQTEAVRRGLSQMGCTPDPGLEPETWRLQTPLPWVTPSNPRFRVTLEPGSGAVEGTFVLLFGLSRRLRAAGAG